MTIKQVSTLAFDNLPASQVEWLENQDPAACVEVLNGDESIQYQIEMLALTERQAIERLAYGQRIVYGERPSAAPAGCEAAKAYFRNEYAYEQRAG